MSTTSRNRRRGRRAYDVSPSPPRSRSPTLVASRSASESTISLPRHNNTYEQYGQRGQYGQYEQYHPTQEQMHRAHDSIAKASIIFGVFTVIAGVVSLRKSKKAREKARLQEEHEASQRRERRRRERDQASRAAHWAQYGSHGYSQRIGPAENSSGQLRIEASPRAKNNGRDSSRYGSDAGRSRR